MSPISWKIRARSPLVEVGRVVDHEPDGSRRPVGGGSRAVGQAATTRSRPAALGPVERPVRLGDEVVDRLVGARRDGDPDRHADRRRRRTGAGRAPPTDGADPLADLEGDLRARVPQQDDELLAAVPGRARRPRGRPPTIAPPTARRTSSPVAWPCVSLSDLEPVDVDHQDADRVVRPAAPGEQPAELVEVAPVRQARSARPSRPAPRPPGASRPATGRTRPRPPRRPGSAGWWPTSRPRGVATGRWRR